jgi:hypothetical protein
MNCPVPSVTSCFDVPADALPLAEPCWSPHAFASRTWPAISLLFSSPLPCICEAFVGSSAVLVGWFRRRHDRTAPASARGARSPQSRRPAQSIMSSSRQSTHRLRNDKFGLRNRDRFPTQAPASSALGRFRRNPREGGGRHGRAACTRRVRCSIVFRDGPPISYCSGQPEWTTTDRLARPICRAQIAVGRFDTLMPEQRPGRYP